MTGKGALATATLPIGENATAVAVRVSPGELERAALVLARDLRAHLLDGLAHGRLGAVLTVGRQAEHFVALVGPAVADQAFRVACQAPPAGG